MRIVFSLPQDTIEGRLTAVDQDGRSIQFSRFVWEPYFYRPSAVVPVLFASVQDSSGQDKSRVRINISGRTGQMHLLDHAPQPVAAAFETPTSEKTSGLPNSATFADKNIHN